MPAAGDLELMSTSTDGGLTWGPPTPTADNVHGLGGQPVVQPNGRVVVPFEGLSGTRHPGLQLRRRWRDLERLGADIDPHVAHACRACVPRRCRRPRSMRRDRVRRLAGQPLRTGRQRQRHRAEQLGGRHHLVAGQPNSHRSGRQQHRSLHPGPGRRPHASGRGTALALTYYFEQPAGCVGWTCADPGRVRVVAQQRADVELAADAQRSHAAGLDRPDEPGRDGRRLHLHLVRRRPAARHRRDRNRLRADGPACSTNRCSARCRRSVPARRRWATIGSR